MTATIQAPTQAQLAHIPLEHIHINESQNPRTTMDDARLEEITASVQRVGVIQPIIVTAGEAPSTYTLIAGHRRVRASHTAKLKTIPALVYEQVDEQARLQLAIIENLQREDLGPIDEAAGYERAMKEFGLTQKQLAEMVSKSASHISERLKLRRLPAECQQHIASGALPLGAAKALAQIARHAPAVADGCARLVATGEADVEELTEEPHRVVAQLVDVDWDDAPFVQPCRTYTPGPIRFRHHIEEVELAPLAARAEALGLTRFAFSEEDLDAARAYKCLLEIEGSYSSHRYVTDARFTFDRLLQSVNAAEAEQAAQSAELEPQDGHADDESAGGDGAARALRLEQRRAAKEEAARAKEREQQVTQRLEAITANRQLGVSLAKKLGARKVDRGVAELLARIVLGQNREMAAGGIRYTHEDYHELEHVRQKNGKVRTKFTPIDSHKAHEQLTSWVLRPKQPEEIIGRLLQAIVAGTFADQAAVVKSQRVYWSAPGSRETQPLVAKLAKVLLPEHFQHRAGAMMPQRPARSPKATSEADVVPGNSDAG